MTRISKNAFIALLGSAALLSSTALLKTAQAANEPLNPQLFTGTYSLDLKNSDAYCAIGPNNEGPASEEVLASVVVTITGDANSMSVSGSQEGGYASSIEASFDNINGPATVKTGSDFGPNRDTFQASFDGTTLKTSWSRVEWIVIVPVFSNKTQTVSLRKDGTLDFYGQSMMDDSRSIHCRLVKKTS
jgi:hypothetical protein